MILCEECHERTDCQRLHAFRSHGRCEFCGKEADCIECERDNDDDKEKVPA